MKLKEDTMKDDFDDSKEKKEKKRRKKKKAKEEKKEGVGSGIWRDWTLAEKLIYILNDDTKIILSADYN